MCSGIFQVSLQLKCTSKSKTLPDLSMPSFTPWQAAAIPHRVELEKCWRDAAGTTVLRENEQCKSASNYNVIMSVDTLNTHIVTQIVKCTWSQSHGAFPTTTN